MPDGRKYPFARTTAGLATTLTLVGVGFATAGPAAAAPQTEDIDAAQARVDRLSQQADTASKRHDDASATLKQARTRAQRLTAGITAQQRTVADLRAQVADMAAAEYTGGAGTSVGSTPQTNGSTTLLNNVTVVTEDTEGRTQRIAASSIKAAQLAERREDVRARLGRLRAAEKATAAAQSTADAKVTQAASVLSALQVEAQKAQDAAEAKQAAAEKAQAPSGGSVVDFAMAQVGKSYVWGAAGPSSFDCSGLTMAAWATKGVSLPHSSSAQYSSGQHVSESELAPGDLVFYYSPISHVGIYIGNGKIVNALNPGAGIQVSGLHDMPYVGAVHPG